MSSISVIETTHVDTASSLNWVKALSNAHQRWLPPFVLAIATTILFWPATSTFFVGDDFWWIYDARYGTTSFGGWVTALVHANGAGTYRPLTQQVFFWICWNVFGADPLGYHLVDLGVFVVTALAIYALVQHFVRSRWTAVGAAALWAFSITHYQSLDWVAAYAETGAVLCVAFSLLGMVRGRRVAMLIWYIAALMSNETATVVPALATVYFLAWEREGILGTARKTASLWVTFVVYLIARATFIGLSPSGPFTLVLSPVIWLKLTVSSALWMLGFTPTFHNVAQYSTSPWEQAAAIAEWAFLLGIAVAVIYGIWRVLKRRDVNAASIQLVLIGFLWFLIGLSPVLPIARDYSDYNLSVSLIGFPLILAGLAKASGRLAPAVALWVGATYLCVNLIAGYGPGGTSQVDGAALYARAAYYAYVQMTAYEQRHPGPIHVQVNSSPAVLWDINGNWEADLIAHGSTVCYGETCPVNPDLRFHWNDATSGFDP